MSAKSIIDALIVLNESALTIEQIAGMVARARNNDVPTEEEIDQKAARNLEFVERELSQLAEEDS